MKKCLICHADDKIGPHCQSPGCTWSRCTRCRVTYDPENMHATNDDGRINWPTQLDELTGEAEA